MARSLLFMAWSLVLWGSLVVLATLWLAGTQGGAAAWTALFPQRPGPLHWLNLVAAVVAVMVWTGAAIVLFRLRHSRQGVERSTESDPIE